MAGTNVKKEIKGKKIWILERAELEKDANEEYVFVGPCAQFNSYNDNDRMYDKEDYLSHVEYLKEEAKERSLMGELDHNDDYMVSMKSISHMILDLWYDEKTDQVMIKIKLLDTRDGKDAKAIVDGGAPLYISSRASGFIDDDGNVTLEQIYTFDIVYRPGFKNAKLDRLNEEIGVNVNSVAIYERKTDDPSNRGSSMINKSSNKKKKHSDNMESEYVTEEKFDEFKTSIDGYTKKIAGQLDSLKTLISENAGGRGVTRIKQGKNFGRGNKKNPKRITEKRKRKNINESADWKVIASAGDHESVRPEDHVVVYETNAGDFVVAWNKDGESDEHYDIQSEDEAMKIFQEKVKELGLEDKVNEEEEERENDDIPDNVEQKVNELEGMVQELHDEKESLYDYVEMAKDRVNGQGDFMNLIAKFCNKLADAIDVITVRVNDMTDREDLVVETVNDLMDLQDMTINRINDISEYSDMTSKRVNEVSEYVSMAGKNQNKLRKAVIENRKNISGKKRGSKRMNEAIRKRKLRKKDTYKKGKYTKKVDEALKAAKKKKAEKNRTILEAKYPFVSRLDKGDRQVFEGMNEIKKKRVSNILQKTKVSKDQVGDVISQVNEDSGITNLLRYMPEKFVPIWEDLSVKEQNKVIALSQTKDIRSEEEVEFFWENLDLGYSRPSSDRIDERFHAGDGVPTMKEGSSELGYAEDDIDSSLGIN